MYDIVMETTSRNYFEASRFIAKMKRSSDIVDEVQSRIEETNENDYDQELVVRLHQTLMETQEAKEYFYSRGITDEAMKEFQLGFSLKKKMVTVPVQSVNGEYVGHVGRSINEKKFKNSSGLPRKYNLFNLNRSKYTTVAIVESSFDAIRLWQLGIPAVATLGATISMQQIELLNKWSNGVLVVPDSDQAGEAMIKKITSHCYKPLTIIHLPDGVKDVGDMSDSQIEEYIKDRTVLDELLSI